ncbi:MAG: hypothetical protein JXX28_02095 [Deltaproteobacteria bacterium]|nr:hypothetical protein [Deltaproteobacteria bacterium]
MSEAWRVQWSIFHSHPTLTLPGARYDLLRRLAGGAARQGLTLLAFGLGPEALRILVLGPEPGLVGLSRGLKVGTRAAHPGSPLRLGPTIVDPADDLDAGAVWAHLAAPAPEGPLSTPWSSHRDLLGYRDAPFFSRRQATRWISPGRVHALAGGGALPVEADEPPEAGLGTLLRISGGVSGRLPADYHCFPIFSQLARDEGWSTEQTARALDLTPRRVRQLRSRPHPLLAAARVSLCDRRLRAVP